MDDATPDPERVPVSSTLSRATRRRLRVYCAAREVQMQDVMESAVTAWLDAHETAAEKVA